MPSKRHGRTAMSFLWLMDPDDFLIEFPGKLSAHLGSLVAQAPI
ncbi:hypothetical protein ACFPFV_04920 [Salinicoccus siamensis]